MSSALRARNPSNECKAQRASMAESSGNNTITIPAKANDSASLSPIIAHLAQDQLFSILLLLPVDSVLSFAMTCKRLRSLTYSDSLWESIFQRDWGHAAVDSLKSSVDTRQLPWKKLYQQLHQLDSVSCHKMPERVVEDEFPRPRASHSLNFVSGCLVLYGGGCEGGRHLDDTWVAHVGNDFRGILKWQKVNTGIPSGRFGHSCVVIGDSLVLFGGINDHGIRQNDTWVGKVTFHMTIGVTFSWMLLDVGALAPPPRGAHAGCCIDNKRMLIHGGIGLSGLRLCDTWILELSENICFGTWNEIVTHPSPSARSGHTLTCTGGTQTVLFGGRGLGYEVLDDVWLFDTSGGDLRWVELEFELRNIPGGLSLPRVGHSATLILGDRVLIYGGEDSYRHRKDDFWVLDIGSRPKGGMSVNMWRKLKSKGYKPSCRSFHRACTDYSERCLYVFGGMVDGLIQPAEAYALKFDGELFIAELELQLYTG